MDIDSWWNCPVPPRRLCPRLRPRLRSPLASGAALPPPRAACSAALGLDTGQLRTAADLDARLERALGEAGEALLVLDNAEHVLEPVIAAITALSRTAPRVRLLVTSQVRLGLRGERVIEVTPLEPEHAAALFLDRAAAVGAPYFRASVRSPTSN